MSTRALSLLEVIIALAILTVSILSIVPLFAHGISYAKRARALTEATHLLRSEMEEILSTPLTKERLEEISGREKDGIAVEIQDFQGHATLKVVMVRRRESNGRDELFLVTVKHIEQF